MAKKLYKFLLVFVHGSAARFLGQAEKRCVERVLKSRRDVKLEWDGVQVSSCLSRWLTHTAWQFTEGLSSLMLSRRSRLFIHVNCFAKCSSVGFPPRALWSIR